MTITRADSKPIVLLLAIGTFACSGGDRAGPVATVRDSAGIEIIDVSGEAAPEKRVPTHIATLLPPDSMLPSTPWGIATNPAAGRIYVADRMNARIVVFDSLGEYVDVFGRPGGGPGEFRTPSAVHWGADGLLRVWDTGRSVISTWSSAGEFLSEEDPELSYWGPGFAAGSDRLVSVTGRQADQGLDFEQWLEVSRGGERQTLYELSLPRRMLDLPCARRPAQTVFAPTLLWASRGDSTYVLKHPEYRVDVFEDTALVASIRRAVAPLPVTEAMAVEAVQFGPGPFRSMMRMCNVTPEQVVRAVGHQEQIAPVQYIAVDPEGRLWVTRTNDGSTPTSIDVFAEDGTFIHAIEAPGAVVGFASPTRFLSFRIDRKTGEPLLSLHSLAERAALPAAAAGFSTTSSDNNGSKGGQDIAKPSWTPPPADDELKAGDEFRDCPYCPVLVVLPEGKYRMGSPEGEAVDELRERWHHLLIDEKPQVDVEIAYPLAAGKYEVTFAEWDYCVQVGACSYDPADEGFGRENRPVLNVNRVQAREYLAWLSEETGHMYRLPSEAEWEYAARAGTSAARYWGEEADAGMAVCDGCGSRWDGRSSAPVGSFPANPFGLHDMLGNVNEWVSDCYYRGNDVGPTNGAPRLGVSPYWEDGTCTVHVRRGGAWSSSPWVVRAASRTPVNTEGPWGLGGDYTAGFRVFRELGAGGTRSDEGAPNSSSAAGAR